MIESIPYPETPFRVNEVFQTERGIFVGQIKTRKIARGVPVFGLTIADQDYVQALKNALNSNGETTMATTANERSHKCTILDPTSFTNNNVYSFIVNKEKRGTVWGIEIHFPYNSAGFSFTKESKEFDIGNIHYALKYHTLKDPSDPLGGSLIDDIKNQGFTHSKNNPYLFYKSARSETEANGLFKYLKDQVAFYYNEALDRFPRLLNPEPEPIASTQVSVAVDENVIAQKVVEAILNSDRFMDILAERIAAKIKPPAQDMTVLKMLDGIFTEQKEIRSELIGLVTHLQLTDPEPEPDDEDEDEDEYEEELEVEEGVNMTISVPSASSQEDDLSVLTNW